MQAALLAVIVFVSATSVDPGPIALGGEAHIVAVTADAGTALRASSDLSAVPSAPAPRRLDVEEARATIAPYRALAPRAEPRVHRRTPRRRVPRMKVESAADH